MNSRATVLVSICLLCGGINALAGTTPKVLLGSTFSPIEEIYAPTANWPFCKQNLDGWTMHLNRISSGAQYDINTLENIIDCLTSNSIPLFCPTEAIHFNAANPAQTGTTSGQYVTNQLARLYNSPVNGTCEGLYLDGPIHRILWTNDTSQSNLTGLAPTKHKTGFWNGDTPDYQAVANQLCDFIDVVKTNYPNMKIYFIVQPGDWGWDGEMAYRTDTLSAYGNGDYKATFNGVYSQMIAQGSDYEIEALVADMNYGLLSGTLIPDASKQAMPVSQLPSYDWIGRFGEYETLARTYDLEFHFFPGGNGGFISDERYWQETLAHLELVLGGEISFDTVVANSWYFEVPDLSQGIPSCVGDENEPYSLTAIGRYLIEKVKNNSIYFGFNSPSDEREDWDSQNCDISVTNGNLDCYAYSSPQVKNEFLAYRSDNYPKIKLDIDIAGGKTVRLYYKTLAENTWDMSRMVSFETVNGVSEYEVNFDLYKPNWPGKLVTGIRIDPLVSNTVFAINSIQMNAELIYHWHHTGKYMGWTAQNLSMFYPTGGSLRGNSSSNDPICISPEFKLSARQYDQIHIRMLTDVEATAIGQFYWKTEHDNTWNMDQFAAFTTINDGVMHDYTIDLSSNPDWRGTVTQIRLDPAGAYGTGSKDLHFEIDYVKVLKN